MKAPQRDDVWPPAAKLASQATSRAISAANRRSPSSLVVRKGVDPGPIQARVFMHENIAEAGEIGELNHGLLADDAGLGQRRQDIAIGEGSRQREG